MSSQFCRAPSVAVRGYGRFVCGLNYDAPEVGFFRYALDAVDEADRGTVWCAILNVGSVNASDTDGNVGLFNLRPRNVRELD